MADIYTLISTPPPHDVRGGEVAYGFYGRLTRDEAVKAARASCEYELERCRRFLALSDEELTVRITRGWNVSKTVEVL